MGKAEDNEADRNASRRRTSSQYTGTPWGSPSVEIAKWHGDEWGLILACRGRKPFDAPVVRRLICSSRRSLNKK